MNEKNFFVISFLPFLFWSLFLYLKKYPFNVGFRLRKNHLLQPLAATCIYIYWGQYFPDAYTHIIHLFPQFLFAYLLKIHLSWSRKREIIFDFVPLPIVISTNFFMWFPMENFYLYYVLITIAFVAKEFIWWKGKEGYNHIFNPSSIALVVFGIFLITTNSFHLTLGQTVSSSLNIPPHMFELLFCIGVFINFFIPILWITLGALLVLAGLHYVPLWMFDFSFHGVPFDVPIFLGMTLLVTDPSSTPRSPISKFLFGLAYGFSIFFASEFLSFIGAPTYYDKLLFVPFLNLSVPWFNKLGEKVREEISSIWLKLNSIQVASIYGLFFYLILPALKKII